MDDTWQSAVPAAFPSLQDWRSDVDSVDRLSNPESLCQQVLEVINRVSAQKFGKLEAAFFDLTVLCHRYSRWSNGELARLMQYSSK